MQSVVTGQTPTTLEWESTPGKNNKLQNSMKTQSYDTHITYYIVPLQHIVHLKLGNKSEINVSTNVHLLPPERVNVIIFVRGQ